MISIGIFENPIITEECVEIDGVLLLPLNFSRTGRIDILQSNCATGEFQEIQIENSCLSADQDYDGEMFSIFIKNECDRSTTNIIIAVVICGLVIITIIIVFMTNKNLREKIAPFRRTVED